MKLGPGFLWKKCSCLLGWQSHSSVVSSKAKKIMQACSNIRKGIKNRNAEMWDLHKLCRVSRPSVFCVGWGTSSATGRFLSLVGHLDLWSSTRLWARQYKHADRGWNRWLTVKRTVDSSLKPSRVLEWVPDTWLSSKHRLGHNHFLKKETWIKLSRADSLL